MTAEELFDLITEGDYTVEEFRMLERAVRYLRNRLASQIAQELEIGDLVEFPDQYGRNTLGHVEKVKGLRADLMTERGAFDNVPLIDIKIVHQTWAEARTQDF